MTRPQPGPDFTELDPRDGSAHQVTLSAEIGDDTSITVTRTVHGYAVQLGQYGTDAVVLVRADVDNLERLRDTLNAALDAL